MARRGLSNAERLALDTRAATATSTVASGPLFLYSIFVSVAGTNTTAEAAFSNVTATAAADFGVAANQICRVRLGTTGDNVGQQTTQITFPKPVYVGRDVGVSSTNAFVSLAYYPSG